MTARDFQDRRLRLWATYASVAVASTLVLIKLAAFLVTGAVSVLSSTIDAATDLLGSLVTLFGVRVAVRPPDSAHRFGHGKAEALSALAQAAFVAGSAAFLVIEGVRRLVTPQAIVDSGIGIVVMLVSMALTLGLVVFQRHCIRRTGSLAIGADNLNYTGDLMMNAAVIAALVLVESTGVTVWDTLFGFLIAAILVRNAATIARRALDVLMDRELPDGDRDRIEAIVLAHDDSRGLHDLRTRTTGAGQFIELHLELDRTLSLGAAHEITDEIERRLRMAFPDADVMIHQEPAGLRDDRLDDRIAASHR